MKYMMDPVIDIPGSNGRDWQESEARKGQAL